MRVGIKLQLCKLQSEEKRIFYMWRKINVRLWNSVKCKNYHWFYRPKHQYFPNIIAAFTQTEALNLFQIWAKYFWKCKKSWHYRTLQRCKINEDDVTTENYFESETKCLCRIYCPKPTTWTLPNAKVECLGMYNSLSWPFFFWGRRSFWPVIPSKQIR